MSLRKVTPTSGGLTEAFTADRLGMLASTLCIVHCVLTPLLLSFSAVFAHLLPSEEKTHRSLAVVVATIGAISLLYGYRKHRRRSIPFLMATGFAFILAGAWWGDRLPSHWVEVTVTVVGSGFMIAAHRNESHILPKLRLRDQLIKVRRRPAG